MLRPQLAVMLCAALGAFADPDLEENVYVLTPENFDEWIDQQEHAIVGVLSYLHLLGLSMS